MSNPSPRPAFMNLPLSLQIQAVSLSPQDRALPFATLAQGKALQKQVKDAFVNLHGLPHAVNLDPKKSPHRSCGGVFLLSAFFLSGCQHMQLAPHPIPVYFQNSTSVTSQNTPQNTHETVNPQAIATHPNPKNNPKPKTTPPPAKSPRQPPARFFLLEDWF